MIVVTGHPRCGTRYVAALFCSVGVHIDHERIGDAGISSWTWAVRSPECPWGVPRGEATASPLIHLLRRPDLAVASIRWTEASTEEWRRKWVWIPATNAIERAVFSLLGWSALIQAQGPDHTFQLEQAEMAVSMITDKPVEPLDSDDLRNVRKHPSMTSPEIRSYLSPLGSQAWDRLWMEWGGAAQ